MNLVETKPAVSYFFFGTATAMPETKVKICSSAGSYTLSPWLASVRDNVTMTGVSWKCWNTDSKSWTEVFHWDDCKGCFMLLKTLADDSLPQCSSDGNLIVDRLKGWPAGTFTRYWVESRLSDGSNVHRVYKVEFILCKNGFHYVINTSLRKKEKRKKLALFSI